MNKSTKFKKYKRRLPLAVRLLIVLGVAVLAFLMILLVLHFCGIRYITVTRPDGGEIRFIGRVGKDDQPIAGTIYFADGTSAAVDVESGVLNYSDRTAYKGGLSEDFRRDGTGILVYANGDRYTGDFVLDKLTGKGVYEFASGEKYEGDLVNGIKHGKGKYTHANGDVYEGGFVSDFRSGEGELTLADGSHFVGTFVNGIKQGHGIYTYSNGDVYDGDYDRDMRQGKGTYTWSNGESYTGDFANNTIHGFGTYTWPNGRASYTGYFEGGAIKIVTN
ncbi:MAG: hypothetical protein MJ102_07045 [Clostridia bacterium]|nr:hypothetical protein [Clostridia bacterium]